MHKEQNLFQIVVTGSLSRTKTMKSLETTPIGQPSQTSQMLMLTPSMLRMDSCHWVRTLPISLSLKMQVSKISKASLEVFNATSFRTGQAANKSLWSSSTTLDMESWTTLSMLCATVDQGLPSTYTPCSHDLIPWLSRKELTSWESSTAAGRS